MIMMKQNDNDVVYITSCLEYASDSFLPKSLDCIYILLNDAHPHREIPYVQVGFRVTL